MLAVYVCLINRLKSEHVERNAISDLGGTHEYVYLDDHPEGLSVCTDVFLQFFCNSV